MTEHTTTLHTPGPNTLTEAGGYDLAETVTGICRGTLYFLVHERRIPHVRLSKRMVRFRRADLERWLDERAVAVVPGRGNP